MQALNQPRGSHCRWPVPQLPHRVPVPAAKLCLSGGHRPRHPHRRPAGRPPTHLPFLGTSRTLPHRLHLQNQGSEATPPPLERRCQVGPGGLGCSCVGGLSFQSKASEPHFLPAVGSCAKGTEREPRLSTCPHLRRAEARGLCPDKAQQKPGARPPCVCRSVCSDRKARPGWIFQGPRSGDVCPASSQSPGLSAAQLGAAHPAPTLPGPGRRDTRFSSVLGWGGQPQGLPECTCALQRPSW